MDRLASRDRKDLYGGILVLTIGALAAYGGASYGLGTLDDMGPGFFPVAVGIILAILGAGMALRSWSLVGPRQVTRATPEWRGWVCILLGVLSFIVVGNFGGLLPASFSIVFISALGDRSSNVTKSLILAAIMTVICVVVFRWGLQLQFPLLQWG
jgi:hypothetical protein